MCLYLCIYVNSQLHKLLQMVYALVTHSYIALIPCVSRRLLILLFARIFYHSDIFSLIVYLDTDNRSVVLDKFLKYFL